MHMTAKLNDASRLEISLAERKDNHCDDNRPDD